MLKSLDWTCGNAVNRLVGLDSAQGMAHNYLKGEGTFIDKVNSLLRWQNSKAGSS